MYVRRGGVAAEENSTNHPRQFFISFLPNRYFSVEFPTFSAELLGDMLDRGATAKGVITSISTLR